MSNPNVVDHLDPDWRDHFLSAEQAADFYRTFAPVEYERAERETDEEDDE